MNYSEMIHAYFDEGVDTAFEDLLFERLATDGNLRREFTEHLRLHTMITADARQLRAPLRATRSVFAALGLPAPAAAASPDRAPAAPPRRRVLPHAATALVTAVVVFAVMAAWQPFSARGLNESVAQARGTAPSPLNTTGVDRAAPAQPPAGIRAATAIPRASGASARTAEEPAQTGAPALAVAPRTAEEPGQTGAPALAVAPRTAEEPAQTGAPALAVASRTPGAAAVMIEESMVVPASQPAREQPFIVAHSDRGNDRFAPPAAAVFDDMTKVSRGDAVPVPEAEYTPPFLSHFQVEMRVLNSRSNPEINLPYSSYSMFKDLAFSVLYRIDRHHAVGLEYGRESFGQEFYSNERIDEPLVDLVTRADFDKLQPWMPALYQRNAMLDWCGAVWRVNLPEASLFSIIQPYTHAFLGGTRSGPLGKARIGIQIAPTRYSMLNLGLEGTWLRYRYEGVWYSTKKIGFTCGLAIGM
jgi:hypothetical protein